MKEILEAYAQKKNLLSQRLNQFKKLKESEYIREFQFCLLTPQSNAQKCWQAIEEIKKLEKLEKNKIFNILKIKTRFHITKTNYILDSQKTYKKIQPLLANQNRLELRNQIEKDVKGMGLKESSHFLRNIGKSDNQIAILDRHILRNLLKYKVIDSDKIKSKKQYLEFEQKFINFANTLKITADELDLLWWSQENGEIFK